MEVLSIAQFILDLKAHYDQACQLEPLYLGEVRDFLRSHENWLLKKIKEGTIDYSGFSKELYTDFKKICDTPHSAGHVLEEALQLLLPHVQDH